MRSTLLHRAAAVLTGLGLVTGWSGFAATPAQAARYSVSVRASDATVTACEGVNLTGRVSPRPSRRTVTVQERLVGQSRWTTVATVKTTKQGRYRTTVVPASAGDRYYRVRTPKHGKRKAGYSRQLFVRVGEQVGDLRACAASSALAGGGSTTITGVGVGSATRVTFTPQLDGDQLAAGFTSMPAVEAEFAVIDDHTLTVRVPAGLGGANLITASAPGATITANFTYKRTWRSPTAFEASVLSELNQRRAKAEVCNGRTLPKVHPLRWDGGLGDLALSHSRDLVTRQQIYQGLDHVTAGTRSVSTRFALAGVTGAYGEVLALSPRGYTAAQVVNQWMKSTTGHCESVMSAAWTKAGVGVAAGVWLSDVGAQDSNVSNVDFQ